MLSAEHITKSYNKRPIIRDISLHLSTGEIVGLLGPNGAGKTTCFSILAGLINADSGKVLLDKNTDISKMPIYERANLGVVYLPQESSIFKGLTVAENILAVLEFKILDEVKREQYLEELLGQFSISHLRNVPAIALSGGERRRLEIARIIACKPKFILLDEPLAGIDPIAVTDIKSLIMQLKKLGIAVLITDHNVKETLNIVDRAYIIFEGKVLMEGTPQEIAANKAVRSVYLGQEFIL